MSPQMYAVYAAITALIVLTLTTLCLFVKSRFDQITARKALIFQAAINANTFSQVFGAEEKSFDEHVNTVIDMHTLN